MTSLGVARGGAAANHVDGTAPRRGPRPAHRAGPGRRLPRRRVGARCAAGRVSAVTLQPTLPELARRHLAGRPRAHHRRLRRPRAGPPRPWQLPRGRRQRGRRLGRHTDLGQRDPVDRRCLDREPEARPRPRRFVVPVRRAPDDDLHEPPGGPRGAVAGAAPARSRVLDACPVELSVEVVQLGGRCARVVATGVVDRYAAGVRRAPGFLIARQVGIRIEAPPRALLISSADRDRRGRRHRWRSRRRMDKPLSPPATWPGVSPRGSAGRSGHVPAGRPGHVEMDHELVIDPDPPRVASTLRRTASATASETPGWNTLGTT